MRVLVSGGGTGGHVYPILAVVEELAQLSAAPAQLPGEAGAASPQGARRAAAHATTRPASASQRAAAETTTVKQPAIGVRGSAAGGQAGGGAPSSASAAGPEGWEAQPWLRYVGETGGIEEALAERAGIPFSSVSTGQMRGRAPWVVARNGMRMVRGARECGALLASFRPDVVLVTGGYVTAPLAWATWRARVPLVIYLPDLTPGMAIRWTSRLASRVAVSFPEVAAHFPGKAVVTGYPVRPELLRADRAEARQSLGLEEAGLPAVLVFGGSRGAHSINQALAGALPALLARCSIVHVSGTLDWPWVAEMAQRLPEDLRARYHPYPYLHDEMIQALAAADLAVARAGASTLGEFPARGLPSILVPYPYAGQHQHANAEYLVRRGAARLIEDGALGSSLAPVVLEMLETPGYLNRMAQAAASLARPDAAGNIARLLAEMGGR